MENENDQDVAASFMRRCEEARAHLAREMERFGLSKSLGWRIYETTREGSGGVELVLRPIHLSIPSPAGFECVVRVEDSGAIDGRCTP
jgi:hypothetical protein